MYKTDGIIVAAGTGNRFNSNLPKQFHMINDLEIICYSIIAMEKAETIDEIILVVADIYFDLAKDIIKKHGLEVAKVVIGGKNRIDSVVNGVNECDGEYIAIHDGARPLIDSANIDRVVSKAIEKDGAILAIKANETVKKASNQKIISTPDREFLWFARTPQVFDRRLYLHALKRLPENVIPTDDAQVMELGGYDIEIVEDSPENIKITYPFDIEYAKIILSSNIND